VDGAPTVKIHGRELPVAATIARLDGMSAHADQSELLRWLGYFTSPPKVTYLVHGEIPAMTTLKQAIEQKLGWNVSMPAMNETVTLPE
jgi:metallo-beta-lactamase family protein